MSIQLVYQDAKEGDRYSWYKTVQPGGRKKELYLFSTYVFFYSLFSTSFLF